MRTDYFVMFVEQAAWTNTIRNVGNQENVVLSIFMIFLKFLCEVSWLTKKYYYTSYFVYVLKTEWGLL